MAKNQASADEGRRFKILHTRVGPFIEGHVIPEERILQIPGTDIDRLLALEAITETDEAVTGEPPLGPENRSEIKVTSTGTVLDAPGYDRPTAPALISAADRRRMRAETAEEAGHEVDEQGVPIAPDEEPGAAEPEAEGEQGSVDYNVYGVAELRKLAAERQLQVGARASKADLVAALEDYDANPPQEAAE